MRIKVLGLAAVSSLSLIGFSTPALAGGCGYGIPAAQCGMSVNVIPSTQPVFGPMTINTRHPMGHLRSVQFNRAPNVSIMRVHSMGPSAGLSDAPSGFTGGCFPTSTNYCRTDVGTPIRVDMAPVAAPYVAPPVMSAPIYQAPVISRPLRTWTGQGYDPSKFAPRQYGDNTFTPGIAYVPTSYVDRNPAHADMALNSGRAVPQPLANGGVAPRPFPMMSRGYGITLPDTMAQMPAMGSQGYGITLPDTMAQMPAMGRQSYGITLPDTYVQGPAMGRYSAPMMGGQATTPVLTQNGTYASNVGADGTYWEKTSGPTMFGNTMATQVICKRKLPTRVVNPVVNVPYAVPTPVPTCGPAPHNVHPGHNARYGAPQGRWTY